MDMLPILSTMLTDFPTMLTDALLMRLKLLKKLSDIVLCVLLTVRFCILISSQPGDQTPDTDLIDLEHGCWVGLMSHLVPRNAKEHTFCRYTKSD